MVGSKSWVDGKCLGNWVINKLYNKNEYELFLHLDFWINGKCIGNWVKNKLYNEYDCFYILILKNP